MVNILANKSDIVLMLYPFIQGVPTSDSNEVTTLSDIFDVFLVLIVDQVVYGGVLAFDPV